MADLIKSSGVGFLLESSFAGCGKFIMVLAQLCEGDFILLRNLSFDL